jgi:hypothetical protein
MAIDRQKLSAESIFTGTGAAAELIGEMDGIADLERKFRSHIVLLRWSAVAAFLVCAGAAIWITEAIIFLGLVAGIAIFVYSLFLDSNGPVHDRVEFLRLKLATLAQDAGSKGRFRVLMRLRPALEKVSERPNPRAKALDDTFFRDPWLTLQGKLADGTSIFVSCTDLVRRRRKTGSRGKVKTKDRKTAFLRIQLDYRPEMYGNAALAARGISKPFRLPAKTLVKSFTFGETTVAVKAIVKEKPTAPVLQAASDAILLGAYRILNLSRKLSASAGGAQ